LGERYDVKVYNQELVTTLREQDVGLLRRFAAKWGNVMANRALLNLAQATDDFVAIRMRMMIIDRPDLSDIHSEARRWLILQRRPHLDNGHRHPNDGSSG